MGSVFEIRIDCGAVICIIGCLMVKLIPDGYCVPY
jgi:hypothetical protein